MADIITNDQHYKDIADAIRGYTQGTEIYKPEEMVGGINSVYSKGFDDGFVSGEELGMENGIAEGKQAQYDLFWDEFQQKGNRTNYKYAFANWSGVKNTFKPKYDIKPVGSVERMFDTFQTGISLPDVCEECGIVMDFSKVTNFSFFMYNYCSIYRIGVIDCSSATALNNAFLMASSLKTIDKLIVHEGITSYIDTFTTAINLQNITVEGTLAGNSLSFSTNTKLTHDSLMSIINALKDYSGTTTTKTVTLGATNLAKLSDTEKAIATDKGWTLV